MYGKPPSVVGVFDLSTEWTEFMHYLYLPVNLGPMTACPRNLEFIWPALFAAECDWLEHHGGRTPLPTYTYVTARRGFATRENPLNRPGWHCDDFGGEDLNYIWSDKYPTRFLVSDEPLDIPNDHVTSMAEFEVLAAQTCLAGSGLRIVTYPPNTLLRLDPYVIHATPDITDGGGMRSFFKISFSNKKYNLLGNSHNYLLDYEWEMHDRQVVRNDPSYAGTDYYEES